MSEAAPARRFQANRRRLLLNAVKAAACVGLLGPLALRPALAQAAPAAVSVDLADTQRAQLAYDVMQEHFFLGSSGLYSDTGQTNRWLPFPYASNWSFSVATRAT